MKIFTNENGAGRCVDRKHSRKVLIELSLAALGGSPHVPEEYCHMPEVAVRFAADELVSQGFPEQVVTRGVSHVLDLHRRAE